MAAVLFDTSVYISVLRGRGDRALELRQLTGGAALWLSSVVLQELYAGASGKALRVVARLERDFDRARRIVVPNLTDWVQAGKMLARLAARYDYEHIGQARLTNDALIASSAGRLGITVMTANPRDFAKLAQVRPFHWVAAG